MYSLLINSGYTHDEAIHYLTINTKKYDNDYGGSVEELLNNLTSKDDE